MVGHSVVDAMEALRCQRFSYVAPSELYTRGQVSEQVSARLIDGRAVHFYLHLVEPALFRRMELQPDQSGIRARLQRDVDGIVGPDAIKYESHGQVFLVDRSFNVADLDSTFGDLVSSGLDLFPRLATVAILSSEDRRSFGSADSFVVWVDDLNPQSLLFASAQSYLLQCLLAVGSFNPGDPIPMWAGTAASIFGQLVTLEYCERSGEKAGFIVSPPDVVNLLSDQDLPAIAAEYVACWWPEWNRGAFIINSPFDLAEEITDVR